MKTTMKLFVYTILAFALSCNASKKAVEETKVLADTQTNEMKTELMNKGYLVGTVKAVEGTTCAFIIVDEKTDVEFDPINFDEDMFSEMRSNDQKVYYTYTPLRMMNRCGNYQPISITDCKKY